MSKRFLLYILVIMGLIWNVGIVKGTATVSGTVSGTWLVTNSPYIVTGTVTVESGTTLTIEPGVVVKFATDTSLINYGTLLAIGNPNGTISFTSNKDIPSPGDWQSIKFSGDTAKGTISYSLIQYARQAIYLHNTSRIVISYNTIRHNKGNDGSNGTNEDSGTTGGIGTGIYLYLSTDNVIIGNIFLDNKGGKGGNQERLNSPGSGGIGCGIYLDSSDNNKIMDNNTIDNTGGTGNPDGNGVGIYCKSSVVSSLIYNNIYNNQTYNLQTDGT
ncbi:MAG: right-handed parallel beta-helix repeat-containing protein, partial [bacterium]